MTESDVITAINAYTYLNCQSSSEASANTNTTANILYTSQSRSQGNFRLFYALAQEQVADDEVRYGVDLSDIYKDMATAYLIGYFYERKFKNWNASTVKSGDDQVTKSGSSFLTSYNKIFEDQVAEAILSDSDTEIVQHTDCINYPAELKDTQLDDINIDIEE